MNKKKVILHIKFFTYNSDMVTCDWTIYVYVGMAYYKLTNHELSVKVVCEILLIRKTTIIDFFIEKTLLIGLNCLYLIVLEVKEILQTFRMKRKYPLFLPHQTKHNFIICV